MEVQLRRGEAHLVSGDELARGHLDRMHLAVEVRLPKIEELRQLGKFRREIIFLPDERLEEKRMVGEMVEDFRRGQAIKRSLANTCELVCSQIP